MNTKTLYPPKIDRDLVLIDWEPKTEADWQRIREHEAAAGNPFCHWSYFAEEPNCDVCGNSTTYNILELGRYERMYRHPDGHVVCETCVAAGKLLPP